MTTPTILIASGTSGSGSALAQHVAAEGGTVGFTYHQAEDDAEDLLADLDGDGHEAWQCDVTDPEDAKAVVTEAFDTYDEIDGIVFTIGVIEPTPVGDGAIDSWQAHLDANVTGAYNLIGAAAGHLKEQGHGSIVALSASEGILRNPELGAYDASKRALEALIQETARELGPAGVRANVVAPGFIRDPDALSDDDRQELLDQQPYKQLTTPEAVADACRFLISEQAQTVTGAVIPVDSGLALQ